MAVPAPVRAQARPLQAQQAAATLSVRHEFRGLLQDGRVDQRPERGEADPAEAAERAAHGRGAQVHTEQ